MNDLPETWESELDDDTLEALFRDIAQTTVLEVLVKGAPTALTDARRPTLEEARAMLAAGEIRGVQLRYVHDGVEWWDTLLATPTGGVRLVRIRQGG